MKPGAMHRARFMSRLHYTSGFYLTNRELKSLKDICAFAVKFYFKSWFSSRLEISAPKNDLQLVW